MAGTGTQDEFYLRYLVKHALFRPVVDVLIANGTRYNLLNSALVRATRQHHPTHHTCLRLPRHSWQGKGAAGRG